MLSHNTYSSLELLNRTAVNFRPCTKVPSFFVLHNKYKHEENSNVQRTISLLRIEDTPARIKLVDSQHKRCLSIATKLVNNASPKVQPYMKLMRIDKPIGMTQLSDNYLLYYNLMNMLRVLQSLFSSKFSVRKLVAILALWMEYCLGGSYWCLTRSPYVSPFWYRCIHNAWCGLHDK